MPDQQGEVMSAAKESATKRSRRIWWSDAAREARNMMRARGLMAGPWLDDVAGRRRGVAVPDQLGRMADEMRGAGIDEAVVRQHVIDCALRLIEKVPA